MVLLKNWFVCFKKPEDAQKAVEDMNGKTIDYGAILYLAKLENKVSRWSSQKKFLARCNLYVRNFDKNVTSCKQPG